MSSFRVTLKGNGRGSHRLIPAMGVTPPEEEDIFFVGQGVFIQIDHGALDLNLVKDVTLNATNDFQLFAETFEVVASQRLNLAFE